MSPWPSWRRKRFAGPGRARHRTYDEVVENRPGKNRYELYYLDRKLASEISIGDFKFFFNGELVLHTSYSEGYDDYEFPNLPQHSDWIIWEEDSLRESQTF